MQVENELSFTILYRCGDGPKEIFKSLKKNVTMLTMHNSHVSFSKTVLSTYYMKTGHIIIDVYITQYNFFYYSLSHVEISEGMNKMTVHF